MEEEALELQAAIERRLKSIQEYSLAQLRECRGPLSLHSELVGEVRQDVAVVQGQLDEYTLLAEDADTSKERETVLRRVSVLAQQLDRLRADIREATLASKRRIDSTAASSQREELLRTTTKASSTSSGQLKGRSDASKDDELMSATASVTDGLRRTRQLMEQELERSVLTTQMLERSSQTLNLTSNQYTSFSDLLNASKSLVTALEKADMLDRLLILAALLFFALVCLLIIKRRIIDRGIRAATLVGRMAGGVGDVGIKGARVLLKETAAPVLQEAIATVPVGETTVTDLVTDVVSPTTHSTSLVAVGNTPTLARVAEQVATALAAVHNEL